MSSNTRSWLACGCIGIGLVLYRFSHSDHVRGMGNVVVVVSLAAILAWELVSRMSGYRDPRRNK
jgi:Na+/phosphate symporter